MVSDIHYCLIKATYKIWQIWNQGFALTVKPCEPRTETFRNNFETRCIKWNCCLCNHIIEKINNIWFTALFSFVFELLSRIFRVTSILSLLEQRVFRFIVFLNSATESGRSHSITGNPERFRLIRVDHKLIYMQAVKYRPKMFIVLIFINIKV